MILPDIKGLMLCDKAYANGQPLIPDAYYDLWRAAVQTAFPRDPYFKTVGSSAAHGIKVALPSPMGSLAKLRPAEAAAWVAKGPKGAAYIATPKLDGISLELVYLNGLLIAAYTRGDGIIGRDVTGNARLVQGVLPKLTHQHAKHLHKTSGTVFVKGEVIIHKSLFAKLFAKDGGGEFAHPRNFCFGMLNRKRLDKATRFALSNMTFVVFGLEREVKGKPVYHASKAAALLQAGYHGFTTVLLPTRHRADAKTNASGFPWEFKPLTNFWFAAGADITTAVLNRLLTEWREDIDICQDGVVLELADHEHRQALGFDELVPSYAFAVKPEIEQQVARKGLVARIEMNISSRRLFKPVYVLKIPLDFDGVKVSRISGHNAGMVRDLGAGVGATISVIRSGDVIPRVVGVVKKTTVKLPTVCPYCRTKLLWTKGKVDLYCGNRNCTGHEQQRLEHFFDVMEVDGLRGGVLAQLTAAGFDTVPKILALTPKQLIGVEGFAPVKTQKLIAGLRKLVQAVKLSTLMHASGCFATETVSLGSRRLELIVRKLRQNVVLTKTIDRSAWLLKLLRINGIGETVAGQFLDGLPEFRSFYQSIKTISLASPEQLAKGGPLFGMTFVWTGYRSNDEEDLVKQQGGLVGGSVTNKTTVLFAAAGGTGKAKAAAAKGITVVDKAQAGAYLAKLAAGKVPMYRA